MVMPFIALAAIAPAVFTQRQSPEEAEVRQVVRALYEVISGPAGQERDWDKFRSLFAEGGKLIATVKRKDGPGRVAMTAEDYIKRNAPAFAQQPFYEREAKSDVQIYGLIAHVWSTYEAWAVEPKQAGPSDKPFDRGINSIQLIKSTDGWKIQQLVWCAESSGFPLPNGN